MTSSIPCSNFFDSFLKFQHMKILVSWITAPRNFIIRIFSCGQTNDSVHHTFLPLLIYCAVSGSIVFLIFNPPNNSPKIFYPQKFSTLKKFSVKTLTLGFSVNLTLKLTLNLTLLSISKLTHNLTLILG